MRSKKKIVLIDKKKIDLTGKEVVLVQGMGFVGNVMALVCANSKKRFVFGIDLPKKNKKKELARLNNGKFPFLTEDKKIELYLKNAIKKKNFYCTSSLKPYSYADIIIVDVNLDISKQNSSINKFTNFSLDLEHFKKAIKTIGENCKDDAIIIIESTVPPGTCKKIVTPIIKSTLKERGLSEKKICIAHSYERVMPGKNYVNSIINFHRVYSGNDQKSCHAASKFLKTIINTKKYPLTKLNSTTETETAKILENSFRAMNIAFMVEWTRFSEITKLNIYNIVKAIRKRPTHKNIMLPGIGVGGYCLTKDPLLAQWSLNNFYNSNKNLDFSYKSIQTNDLMPYYAYRFTKKYLKKMKNKKIILMGCAYTGDVSDTRYSPVEYYYKLLKKNKYKIKVYDPYVKYWNEVNIKTLKKNEFYDEESDAIIVCTGHHKFRDNKNLIDNIMLKKKKLIIDLIGILNDREINKLKQKHEIKILGRGDLD